jgi:hypothetical protein
VREMLKISSGIKDDHDKDDIIRCVMETDHQKIVPGAEV